MSTVKELQKLSQYLPLEHDPIERTRVSLLLQQPEWIDYGVFRLTRDKGMYMFLPLSLVNDGIEDSDAYGLYQALKTAGEPERKDNFGYWFINYSEGLDKLTYKVVYYEPSEEARQKWKHQ